MSDEATATVAGDATSYALPSDAPAEMSVSDAARLLAQARRKATSPPAESAPQATAEEPELAAQADADAHSQETVGEVETEEPQPADELPPIERPRSWAKELDEEWNSYPREAQEKIAKREQERDAAIRRGQNEAAEARKALEAQMAQAEQVRKQYEAKLPELVKAIGATLQQEFGDIQTIQDAYRMQNEDPFRFQKWQLRQMELAAAQKEQQESEQRQQSEKSTLWSKYVEGESKAFADEVPEFKAKEAEYTKKAATVLSDLGFSDDELSKLARGDDKISLYDRRLQRLLFDRIRLDEIKSAPAKAIPKPVPPVARPGTAKGGTPSAALQIQNLNSQLENATGRDAIALAAKLTALKRQASAR